MRGWKVQTTIAMADKPASYTAEKEGWKILSPDCRKFRVEDPSGTVIVDDLGTSLEAHRVAEACIRRAQK